MIEYLPENLILAGLLASLCAGLATSFGAIPVFFIKRLSNRLEDCFLAFAAGVMLTASFFSLIIPALDAMEKSGSSPLTSIGVVIGAILLGVGFVWIINELFPHEHFIMGKEGSDIFKLRKIWLFIMAITIHNFPEGLAVGVGYGAGDYSNATVLAIGIGLQNIPEGLAVAVALIGQGYSRLKSFNIALLSGLVEPIGGLLGVYAISVSKPLLPWGLGFAAGAMLFIISHEIIPETHKRGNNNYATLGFIIGLIVMLFLDVALG